MFTYLIIVGEGISGAMYTMSPRDQTWNEGGG